MKCIVEGIFTYETDSKDPRKASRKAIKELSGEGVKIYIVNAWEKEDEHEEEC